MGRVPLLEHLQRPYFSVRIDRIRRTAAEIISTGIIKKKNIIAIFFPREYTIK